MVQSRCSCIGLISVVALVVYSVPALRTVPELAVLSYPTLVLLAASNSTIVLIVFVGFGAATDWLTTSQTR
ncbi:hypothetical protein [Natrinema salinisoli]|uniref:hypothetical protein n=1 Tax=Natrinema salinisoli TaxID=2878535 RepID=UPI001CF01CF0|nr:hypothetical protein [Natrinema salinisoli]